MGQQECICAMLLENGQEWHDTFALAEFDLLAECFLCRLLWDKRLKLNESAFAIGLLPVGNVIEKECKRRVCLTELFFRTDLRRNEILPN